MPTRPGHYSARLLGNTPVAGGWRLLRLQQAQLQGQLRLGQSLVVQPESAPLKAYLYHVAADWFALLAPPSDLLSAWPATAEEIWITEPLGAGWPALSASTAPVVLAAGAGIAAALAVAEQLQPAPRLVLLDSGGLPLPFRPQPSLFVIGGLPPAVLAAAPLLESRGIPSRLADPGGQPGCFEGSLLELFKLWFASHPSSSLDVFTCLPAETAVELSQIPALRIHDAGG